MRKKYRVHVSKVNKTLIENLLDRKFGDRLPGACVVSDLTYVRVGAQRAFICILLDLGAREIIGYSAGAHKTAEQVHDAFASVKGNLVEIQLFHTDRGSEFDNTLIDEFLENFQIRRSLSMKGCPYDNAVAESTFKMIKAEFVAGRRFDSIEQLRLELADYVHWFNYILLYSTLGHHTPVMFKNAYTLSILIEYLLTIHTRGGSPPYSLKILLSLFAYPFSVMRAISFSTSRSCLYM